jgi:hypothetical protein
MIVLIATYLGVPLWLVLGVLALKLWQRYDFKRQPGVFEAKLRVESGDSDVAGDKWPRVSGYAYWVHQVLLVHKGLGLRASDPLPVAALEGPLDVATIEDAKRLGDNPLLYNLTLDDGTVLQMGVPGEARLLAGGPFAKSSS